MYKKMMILILALLFLTVIPMTVLAGSGDSNNENGGAVNNAGEFQQLNIQNQNQTQIQTSAGLGNDEASLERIMQATHECLQTMENDCLQTGEKQQVLEENLVQLKQQYQQQTQIEVKEEIKSTFKTAIQLKKSQGKIEETESLVRDLISLDPKDPEAYRELGAILCNRGEKDPKLFLNGVEVKADVPPVIKEGRTLVPVRALTEALGAEVQWNEQEQTVLVSNGNTQIQLKVNNRIALVNGEEITLDVPAEINTSRIFVPLRFMMQTMNTSVEWYPEGQIISMNE